MEGESVALEVRDVSYSYGEKDALHSVSASWPIGVNAVLGPNGAGKTTLLRLLCGLTAPQSGCVFASGARLDKSAARSRQRAVIGYLPQEPRWDMHTTATQFLTYFAFLRGVPRRKVEAAVRLALEAANLTDKANHRLGAMSGGERRRVYLAQTLVHDPRILILDEPSAGLDPVQRVKLRQLIGTLGQDKTIVLATHLVEDAVSLNANTLVLSAGSIIWRGLASDLNMGTKPADSSGAPVWAQGAELGLINLLNGSNCEPV